jgi:hypothetical protein
MKLLDKIKRMIRRLPPTEEEIARAQAEMIRQEQMRRDGEAGPYI